VVSANRPAVTRERTDEHMQNGKRAPESAPVGAS